MNRVALLHRRAHPGAILSRSWVKLGWWCLVWALAFASGHARAEVTSQLVIETAKVELGQPVRVELTVSSDEGAPASPRLDVPPGFIMRGPTVSTRFSTSISGWSAQTRREITASWLLTAPKTGVFTIGPARAVVESRAIASNSVRLQVVPAGTLPQRSPPSQQRRRPSSLFDDDDLFPGFPGLGRSGRSALEDMLQRQRGLFPDAPPGYQLPNARDATAFLDASVSPQRAVVGQQVTLRIIAYGAAGRFRESDTREPRRPDFFSMPITESSAQEQLYSVTIGDREYLAVKVREFALFPLKAGKLEIGPMQMAFYGSNYISPSTQQPLERHSQTLIVDVTEPPAVGRPLGYQVGDVGEFTLSASVTPRTVNAGSSFSVTATLEGEGRLPQSLRVPEQKGIDWLEPTVEGNAEPDARGVVRGKRVFTYIVQASRAGTFDLGELSLPYYNADQERYQTARATLGQVVVNPAAASVPGVGTAASAPLAPEVRLSETARARAELQAYSSRSSSWAYSPWLWLILIGAPLGVVLGHWGFTRVQHWSSRKKHARSALSNLAQDELRRAKDFSRRGDTSGAIAALERGLFQSIEHATGVKARALLREQLEPTLAAAGLEAATSKAVTTLLSEIEAYRFAHQGDLQDLLTKTQRLLAQLTQSRAGLRSEKAA